MPSPQASEERGGVSVWDLAKGLGGQISAQIPWGPRDLRSSLLGRLDLRPSRSQEAPCSHSLPHGVTGSHMESQVFLEDTGDHGLHT